MEEAFLVDVQDLPYNERAKRVAARAREPGAVELFRALSASPNFDARWCAVQSTAVTRDSEPALAALLDRSALIRNRAVVTVALVGTEEQIVGAIMLLSYPLRRRLMLCLRQRRRWNVMQKIIDRLRDLNELSEMRRLFSLCNKELVGDLIPSEGTYMSMWQWNKVAKGHPEIAAAETLKAVQQMKSPDPGLLLQVSTILPFISKLYQSQARDMLLILKKWFPSNNLPLKNLSHNAPNVVADLLIFWNEWIPHAVDVNRVERRRLVRLIKLEPPLLSDVNWRRRSYRRHVVEMFDELKLNKVFEKQLIPLQLLEIIPPEQRHKEALELANNPLLTANRLEHIKYVSCQPYEIAYNSLMKTIRDTKLEVRKAAFESLSRLICLEPEHVQELIKPAKDCVETNELIEDVFLSLARHPGKRWNAAQVEELDGLVATVIEKHPCQRVYQNMLDMLIVILPAHPTKVAESMKRLRLSDFVLNWKELKNVVLDENCCQVLKGVFESFLSAKTLFARVASSMEMFNGLGRKLADFHDFIRALFSELTIESGAWPIDSMIHTLKSTSYRFFVEIVETLLAKDLTFLKSNAIFSHVEKHDSGPINRWLDDGCCSKGALNPNEELFVPRCFRFTRLYMTVKQQVRFHEIARQYGEKHSWDSPFDSWILTFLGRCHGVELEGSILVDFCKETHPVHNNNDLTARAAMCEHDNIEYLEYILKNLVTKQDSRHVIYQTRKRLMLLNREEGSRLIGMFNISMVSTHKEVCRLLGDLRIKSKLLEFFESETTHRDVKVAIIRALWNWRDDAETWNFFMKAADHPEWKVARKLTFISLVGVSSYGRVQLVRILLKCLARPEVGLRKAALERIAQDPIGDPERLLSAAMLETISNGSPDEQDLAIQALFTGFSSPTSCLDDVKPMVERLAANSRAVRKGLEQTCGNSVYNGSDDQDKILLAYLTVLEGDSRSLKLQLQTILHLHSMPLMIKKVLEFAGRSEDHRLIFLTDVGPVIKSRVNGISDIDTMVEQLLAETNPLCHILAATIVKQKVENTWYDRGDLRLGVPLSTLRNSDDLLTRSLALFTMGPGEPDYLQDRDRDHNWRPRAPRGELSDLPGVEGLRRYRGRKAKIPA